MEEQRRSKRIPVYMELEVSSLFKQDNVKVGNIHAPIEEHRQIELAVIQANGVHALGLSLGKSKSLGAAKRGRIGDVLRLHALIPSPKRFSASRGRFPASLPARRERGRDKIPKPTFPSAPSPPHIPHTTYTCNN